MIDRTEYLNMLIESKDNNLTKAITGIRRCGKSSLLEKYAEYLLSTGIKENQIIKLDLENPDHIFKNYMAVYSFIRNKINGKERSYIFLDEIQYINEFDKLCDALTLKANCDVYITSSLKINIPASYTHIKMFPLSFKEYNNQTNNQKEFLSYLEYGAFPEVRSSSKSLTLENTFNAIIYKGVMNDNTINSKKSLECIITFIYDNIGKQVSTKKISDKLTEFGLKISNHTAENYISALIDNYMLYKVERYDIVTHQKLVSGYKFYAPDLGLRYHMLGQKAGNDVDNILKNIVYLELLRRYDEVYIGKYEKETVDFVALKDNKQYLFQVLSIDKKSAPELDINPSISFLTMEKASTDSNKTNLIDWLIKSK